MKEVLIEVNIQPGVLEKFSGPLAKLFREQGDSFPREVQEPEDEDLAGMWAAELREGFKHDCESVIRLIGNPAFGKAGFKLPEAEVESIIRGSSGLRLALREKALQSISDKELESHQTNPASLSPERQQALALYHFLAVLQELLVSILDPETFDPL